MFEKNLTVMNSKTEKPLSIQIYFQQSIFSA